MVAQAKVLIEDIGYQRESCIALTAKVRQREAPLVALVACLTIFDEAT